MISLQRQIHLMKRNTVRFCIEQAKRSIREASNNCPDSNIKTLLGTAYDALCEAFSIINTGEYQDPSYKEQE